MIKKEIYLFGLNYPNLLTTGRDKILNSFKSLNWNDPNKLDIF